METFVSPLEHLKKKDGQRSDNSSECVLIRLRLNKNKCFFFLLKNKNKCLDWIFRKLVVGEPITARQTSGLDQKE